MAYKELESKYVQERIMWKKPAEEGTVLLLEDCEVLFNFFLLGMLASSVCLIIEAISYFLINRFNR